VFETLMTNVKVRAAQTAQSAACAGAAIAAVVCALAFFLAALFVWVEARFGTLEACLMFGGGFLVLAIGAFVALTLLRRRRPPPLNVAAAMPWNDPTLLLGLKTAKSLGGGRAATVGLIGAFVVGLVLSRSVGRK
jgi:hypothetical protein